MTLTVCWSAKGGSGTTVVAAGLALDSARPSALLDVDGDLPMILGVPEPAGQGLSHWFDSGAPPEAILDLAIDLDATTRLIPRGPARIPRRAPRWGELGRWLAASDIAFVADVGLGDPPVALLPESAPTAASKSLSLKPSGAKGLLITRPCYVALMRARLLDTRPDGVILIDERGRDISARDVEISVGAPVVAKVPFDPAIARAVDRGLLAMALPGSIKNILGRAA